MASLNSLGRPMINTLARSQGTSLAQELREQAPHLSANSLSGYAAEATVHGNSLKPEDICLIKLVARDILLQAVAKTITSKSKKPSEVCVSSRGRHFTRRYGQGYLRELNMQTLQSAPVH